MKTKKKLSFKKSFNLSFKGAPAHRIQVANPSDKIGVVPVKFKGLRPKVQVSVGQPVRRGEGLFYDKKMPSVQVLSPVTGRIEAIHYGAQHRLECIEILPNDVDDPVAFESVNTRLLSPEHAKSVVLERGGWVHFVELPFHTIPHPESNPPAIIVRLSMPEPFMPTLSVVMNDVEDYLLRGIKLLKRFAPHVVVVVDANEAINCDAISAVTQVVRLDADFSYFEPGSMIYHLKDTPIENNAWSCDWPAVVQLGATVRHRQYCNSQWVSVGGNQADDNGYYKVIEGANVSSIVQKKTVTDRIVFGGLFTGIHAASEHYLPLGTNAINIIDNHPHPEFMSFLQPGVNKPSFTTAYLSGFLNAFKNVVPTSALNGSERDCVSCGLCETVCPVGALPQYLLRNVKGNDIESAMRHGLLDCANCGVCTYVCPSKIDLGTLFIDAKDQLHNEVNTQ